jgi:hypothetical protein
MYVYMYICMYACHVLQMGAGPPGSLRALRILGALNVPVPVTVTMTVTVTVSHSGLEFE